MGFLPFDSSHLFDERICQYAHITMYWICCSVSLSRVRMSDKQYGLLKSTKRIHVCLKYKSSSTDKRQNRVLSFCLLAFLNHFSNEYLWIANIFFLFRFLAGCPSSFIFHMNARDNLSSLIGFYIYQTNRRHKIYVWASNIIIIIMAIALKQVCTWKVNGNHFTWLCLVNCCEFYGLWT